MLRLTLQWLGPGTRKPRTLAPPKRDGGSADCRQPFRRSPPIESEIVPGQCVIGALGLMAVLIAGFESSPTNCWRDRATCVSDVEAADCCSLKVLVSAAIC